MRIDVSRQNSGCGGGIDLVVTHDITDGADLARRAVIPDGDAVLRVGDRVVLDQVEVDRNDIAAAGLRGIGDSAVDVADRVGIDDAIDTPPQNCTPVEAVWVTPLP